MARDNDVVQDIQDVIDPPKPRKRGKNKYDAELNEFLHSAIDAEMSDAYNYSSAELYTQMATSWQWYFRHPIGNERDGYSQWVSPMIMKHVNQARAFVTQQYFRNSAPVIKFRPKSMEDVEEAELATEYVNYLFRHKLNGHKIVDDLVFNAALLKWNPVRITMKERTQKDEVEFKYKGYSLEEFEDNLAMFFVANPDQADKDPEYKKENIPEEPTEDDMIDVCYRWYTKKVYERYPHIDVISPGAFFVSRQAESEEKARMVAMMTKMSVSEMRMNYPDAPALNGYKKREEEDFWNTIVSDYLEWYTEIEWLSKWSHDFLGFVSQYTEGNDRSGGLGSKEVFVMDAEIYVDPKDTGYSQLCHVIKVGDRIMHKEYITERSYMWSSFVPTANRHLGISFVDLLEQEATEETINTRAYTDATAMAAHGNWLYDPDQVEDDDMENREPDSLIRRRRSAAPKAGVPAVEYIKQTGPDASILTALQSFQATATQLTGVGANFQGATVDETADMRISTETAKIIDNNSSLMLNYFARNFADHLCKILSKLLNVAVNHGASPQLFEIKDRWMEVDPQMLKPRSDFILNADIGVNDAAEKQINAQAIMSMLAAASGGGGQGPNGEPIPQIPVQLTPLAGYEAAKKMLEASGVMNPDTYLVNPNIPPDQAQQAAFMQMMEQMQQMIPQAVAQGVEQAVEVAKQEPQNQKAMAEAAKITAETDRILDESEKDAFEIANKLDAEDRREDEAAMRAAADQDKAETADWKAREDIRLRERELDLQEKSIDQTPDDKKSATAVINP